MTGPAPTAGGQDRPVAGGDSPVRPGEDAVPSGESPAAYGAITCPSCGRAVGPQDNFCEACRAELAPAVVSGEAPGTVTTCPECHSTHITPEGYCESCGHKVPASRDHTELDLGMLAGVTDRGLRHHRNEDAMALATAELASGPAAVAVVCDGVSSSQRPDEASLAAAQAAVQVLLAGVRTGGDLKEASRDAISAAQRAVAGLKEEPGGQDPPSATFVSAAITGETVTLCWLGDSRAYWLGDAPGPAAKRLTTDDSLASEMVAAGLVSEEDALALPQAHVVTGWVGADSGGTAPHVASFEPPGRGVLLLCSDGLWNYQPEAEKLAELALPRALTDPLGAAQALVKFAIDAGGVDNVTVVLAPLPLTPAPHGDPAPSAPPESEEQPPDEKPPVNPSGSEADK
jgi:serine/threonine protein phosphatase PrpC